MGAQKISLVKYKDLRKDTQGVGQGTVGKAIAYRDFFCPYDDGHLFIETARRINLEIEGGEYVRKEYGYWGRSVSDTTRKLFYQTVVEQDEEFYNSVKNEARYSQVYGDWKYKGASATSSTKTTKGTTQMAQETSFDMSLIRELKEAISSLNQARATSPLEEKLLEAVIERTKDIATAELESELRVNLDKFIQKTYGNLPKRIEVVMANKPTKAMAGLFHEKFQDILKLVANNIPVMLTGSAGTGKNYTLEQVSSALDLEFYYTGAITQEYKLTGFIDAGGKFHETEFYKAFKNGGVFMLDEVDASSAETLVILNGAIANRYFDFPNGRIHAHEDFRIVCAGNTFGTGADMVYVGRNVLDGATLDRFAVIKMDYDLKVEEQLCPDTSYHAFIKDMRRLVNKLNLRHIVGMRASINGYRALMAGLDRAFVIESIVMKGLGIDDIQTIVSNMEGSSEWHEDLRSYARKMKGASR